jgi:16S rRNA (guanine527-N7)-methyltransferase
MGRRSDGRQMSPAITALCGRPASKTEIVRFERYLDMLLDWNRTHRLTGYVSAGAIVRNLLIDGLLFLARVPAGPLTMVDLGTGPGIPGVPIRIVRPEISLTLVDARRKHVSFLAALKREIDLPDVTVLEGRAEDLVSAREDIADAFDVVVTRAVGVRIIPAAIRYLKPGGLFLAGGPPEQTDRPGDVTVSPQLSVRWETVHFAGLGRSRTFLVGRKRP